MSHFEIQYLTTQWALLIAQCGLLAATIFFYRKLVANDNQREQRVIDQELKEWCKSVFRGADSPGKLQSAGSKVRERLPKRVNLILRAYEELRLDEPSLDRPALHKFLELMDGVERGKWPHSMLAMSGKLDIYKPD